MTTEAIQKDIEIDPALVAAVENLVVVVNNTFENKPTGKYDGLGRQTELMSSCPQQMIFYRISEVKGAGDNPSALWFIIEQARVRFDEVESFEEQPSALRIPPTVKEVTPGRLVELFSEGMNPTPEEVEILSNGLLEAEPAENGTYHTAFLFINEKKQAVA